MYDLDYFNELYKGNINVIINNTNIKEKHEILAYNLISEVADIYTLEQFDKYLNDERFISHRQLSFFDEQNKAKSK